MEIIQIQAVAMPQEGFEVFGFGNDQKVYAWNWKSASWELYAKEKNV